MNARVSSAAMFPGRRAVADVARSAGRTLAENVAQVDCDDEQDVARPGLRPDTTTDGRFSGATHGFCTTPDASFAGRAGTAGAFCADGIAMVTQSGGAEEIYRHAGM